MRDTPDGDARLPSIRFAGDVNLLVLQAEGVHEVLEESEELLRDFDLIRSGRGAFLGAETGTCWLFHPDDVRQVDPRIWIGNLRNVSG